jgi:hypothetical protein
MERDEHELNDTADWSGGDYRAWGSDTSASAAREVARDASRGVVENGE